MQKADLERLQKIRAHCANIQKTLENLTVEEFKSTNGIDAKCNMEILQK